MGEGLGGIDPNVVEGGVIGGKFVVERLLGEGGMGFVVSAVHAKLGERVALKFLRPSALANPEIVARFAHEARAAARLKGEHIARVLDVGEREDGAPFIVMEHLQGRDLGGVIEQPVPTTIADAAEWIIHACDGLGEAHARGVVHRDVKPENLFLVERDGWRSVKVLDFGISKAALAAGDPELESSISIMGSPVYMSPEQLRGRDVDHRTDIWSLGVVLFELLTKLTPYPSDLPIGALVATILDRPPRALRAYSPAAPDELARVVTRCLDKDPAQRFQHAAELAIALLPFAPRRAKSVAEHAASVTTSAGLAERPLTVPVSIRPMDPRGSAPSLTATIASSAGSPRARGTDATLPEVPLAAPPGDGAHAAPRRYVAPAAAVALVAALGVAVVATRGASAPPTSTASAAEPTAPLPSADARPAPPVAAPLAPLVRVRVTSAPPGASVSEDGVQLCTATPCDVAYEATSEGATHALALSKAGYATSTVTVRAADAHVDVKLAPAPRAPPAAAPKSAPRANPPEKPELPAGFKDLPY